MYFSCCNDLQKRISRLVSIESDERSSFICSDQDSLSCDNEIQSKDENARTDEEAEIEDLMKRIEFMKKDRSILWLHEFKEWMSQSSENFVDSNGLRTTISPNKHEMYSKSGTKDEDLAETSRYISDSFLLSGDESSTIVLESGTSFADTSTVVSAKQYFDRLGEAASRFFMGHAAEDRSLFKSINVNQEDLRFVNNEGSMSTHAGDVRFNSLAVPRGDIVHTKNVISPSTSINDINGSHSSSAIPGSPPHYQEDILHRRHNLEEEFLQLSAESFSVPASSDSSTSCSEDDAAEFGTSMIHLDQFSIDNLSERIGTGTPHRDDEGNACDDKILLKKNGTDMSSACAEGNVASVSGRELEISAFTCSSSSSDAMHDGEIVGFSKGKTDWLEKTKHRRKPRKRMISLPEEDDVHVDNDSSKKSSDHVENCKSDGT